MKKLSFVVLLTLVICSCSYISKTRDQRIKENVSGKTFVREKGGFGGDFYILLNKDGTYQYYVGFLSSYIGLGNWTVEEGKVKLVETSGYDNVFYFDVKDGELVFIKDKSSEFMHVKVEDGDRFRLSEVQK